MVNRFVLIVLFCFLGLEGCAKNGSTVQYHHTHSEGRDFWMTVSFASEAKQSSGSQRRGEASLWYCHAEDRNQPVCTQATLVPCDTKTNLCKIVADTVQVSNMDDESK